MADASPPLAPQTSRDVVLRRMSTLLTERSSFDSHYRDLCDYFMPRRGRFGSTNGDRNRGQKKHQRVVTGMAVRASNTLASGFNSGLTSQARPWFRLTVADPQLADYTPVRRWLDDVAQRMRDVLSRSNFYTTLQPMYRELGVVATAPLGMLEDERDIVRFYNFTVGSYVLGQDDRLVVNTFGRPFELTVGQMVDRYGKDRVSTAVKNLYTSNKLDAKVPLQQLIQPNHEHLPGWKDMRGMPFRSVVIEAACDREWQQPLEDKGFHEFPILAGRWETMEETPYGTSCPGMDALGDNRQLQFTTTKAAELLDKGNTPPLQAPPGLQGKTVSLFPGAITYRPPTQGGDATVTPIYEPDPNWYRFTRESIKDIKQDIQEAFYVDLFRMLDQLQGVQPRNQLELTERREEKLLQLGPVLEQINGDTFDPLIDRLFNMMWRRGQIPPPPAELEGMALKVEYISIMAQAQRAVASGGIERFAMFVANLGKSFGPGALDKANTDQMVDDYAEAIGVHSRLVHSDEEVAEKREAVAQQQQMAQMAALAPAAKQGMDALAKAAGTVPAEGNVLSALAGAAG
jgi:hypothetical protein